jgi:predicted ATPase/class 3 adenylate cyclase
MAAREGVLPTGTVTFLFTDIEGSTRLLQELGRERYAEIQEAHGRLMRSGIAQGDGAEIRTEGDSFFVVFPTPGGAVLAAVACQRALASHPWPHGGSVNVRMGMHTGEGYRGGDDYLGIDVNRAARIAAAGHGGQVLLSAASKGLVEHDLPEGVKLRDLGEHRLKDIAHPEHIYDLVIEGLSAEFPSLKTLEVPTNLPVQLTSFVGREDELSELEALLSRSRLLTLAGPGGSGKTRLGLELAGRRLENFRDGVFFIDLSTIRDPELVPSAVALALGVREQPGRTPLDVVAAYLAGRTVLLVLDNFEQVAGAAPTVRRILEIAPATKLLVTSRVRLDVPGEQAFPVPPLALPEDGSDPERLRENETVALFVDRARAVHPGFELSGQNAAAVVEICTRLEGLPLAIELAAVQVRVLSAGELLARLDKRLAGVGAGSRAAPERQRTLRGAIEWSYDLLDPQERSLFARLSVFIGGASLPAVEAVCDVEGSPDGDILELLTSLVDKSLVRRGEVPEGSRFTMLETIREFAAERLDAEGSGEEMGERHAAFFAALAEEAEPHLTGADRDVWTDRLGRDQGNLRAALQWSIHADRAEIGLRIVSSLPRFWVVHGPIAEGRQVSADVLALPSAGGPTPARARALLAQGSLAYWQSDLEAARGPYEQGLAMARSLGDRRVLAEALFDLAYVEMLDGNFDAADRLFRECGDLREQLGDRLGRAWVNVGLAMSLSRRGRNEEARPLLEEALPVFRELEDRFGIENATGSLAMVAYDLGDLDRAEEWMRENLRLNRRGSPSVAVGVAAMANLALARGDPLKAVRLWGFVEAIQEASGVRIPTDLTPLGNTREEALAALGGDAASASAALEEGRRMTPEEAVRLALGEE